MRFLRRLWVEVYSFFGDYNRLGGGIIFLLVLLFFFDIYIFHDPTLILDSLSNVAVVKMGAIADSYKTSIQNINMVKMGAIAYSYETSRCKGCKMAVEFEIERDNGILVVDYELSHKNYLWRQVHKIFEKVFKMPVDFGWVQINKKLDNVDWSQYTAVRLLVKGTGEPSDLDFSIVEKDGDVWYYFDRNSLDSKDWIEIKMPFEDFTNPSWANQRDGKKDFKNITEIVVTMKNFNEPIKNTLYFKIFDEEIFKLI